MDDSITLSKITYEFYQEGNTDGTTDETEELIVEIEGCFNIAKEPGYMVIRTKTGWSINNPKEFQELLQLIQNGVPIKTT